MITKDAKKLLNDFIEHYETHRAVYKRNWESDKIAPVFLNNWLKANIPLNLNIDELREKYKFGGKDSKDRDMYVFMEEDLRDYEQKIIETCYVKSEAKREITEE